MSIYSMFAGPWPWWFSGTMIGLFLPFFYFLSNHPLGISTGYGNFCKIVVPHTRLEALNSKAYTRIFTWRVFFIVGVVFGATMARMLSGEFTVIREMGMFNSTVTQSFLLSAPWFFTGGTLLGLGARVGSGCTSAHTINGIPNFAASGYIASLAFFIGATVIVNFVYRIVF